MLKSICLNGEWTVRRNGGGECVPASVPGEVFSDLLAAREIPDPFYRDNEERLQWIGESDWLYARSFTIDEDTLANKRVVLRCHGLDTLATVRINGRKVGEADNMFRVWEWEVKELLRPGANEIEIYFSSTLPYIEEREKERTLPWWGQGKSKEKVACHGWVRKQQCNYGWDWGIKAVTCGVWRDIELLAFDSARLTDLDIAQNHTIANQAGLKLTVQAETVNPDSPLRAETTVRLGGKMWLSTNSSLRMAVEPAS